MLLRDSISKAKKLFHKTLQSFKTMLSSGYQRLPKTPPFDPFSCTRDSHPLNSFRELENLYNDFNHDQMMNIKERRPYYNLNDTNFSGTRGGFQHMRKQQPDENHQYKTSEKISKAHDQQQIRGGNEVLSSSSFSYSASSINRREETCNAVAKRLKELELIDLSNVDHLLDVEEILHYYSRITCPFYIDIVNKFFMDMYAEFLPPVSSSSSPADAAYSC